MMAAATMDNLAHTLCGAALAKTRLGKQSRWAFASLLIGANLPDIDGVASLFGGKTAYLVHHRGITHALVGIAVQAILLAAAIRFGERWFERRRARARGEEPPPTPPWRAFLLPALVGLLSHPALDALNNYGVRPFLPFSSARYYADLVFIVDPLLWLLFGAIAALAGPRHRLGHAIWIVLAAAVSWFLYTHPRTPEQVKWYWPLALALLAGLRALGVGRVRARTVLILGWSAIVLYLGGLEASARIAWRNVLHASRPSAQVSAFIEEPWSLAMRSPSLANPFRWLFFLQSEGRYYVREVDVRGRMRIVAEVGPKDLDDPRVRAAMRTPEGGAWHYFARLPWAWVDVHGGRTRVSLTDARYQFNRGPAWCAIEVDLPPAAAMSSGGAVPGGLRGP
jgi:inner membrane protein